MVVRRHLDLNSFCPRKIVATPPTVLCRFFQNFTDFLSCSEYMHVVLIILTLFLSLFPQFELQMVQYFSKDFWAGDTNSLNLLFILAGNDDIHKRLNNFLIRPDPTTDYIVSFP